MSVSTSSSVAEGIRLNRLLSGATEVGSTATQNNPQEQGTLLKEESYSFFSTLLTAKSVKSPLILRPWNPHLLEQTFSNENNFRATSEVGVLRIDQHGTSWSPALSDEEISHHWKSPTPSSSPSVDTSCPEHTLVVFFIHLEFEKAAQYERKASISRQCLQDLTAHIGVHDAAVQNLLGRPDYWSAFWRRKDIQGKQAVGYEFYCQHPRWLQIGRYDKKVHRAPCSVYLHHDATLNTSYYVISAAANDSCMTGLLEEMGVPEQKTSYFTSTTSQATGDPFLIHAIVSGYAYQQSTQYLADVRGRLMAEIAEVNNYSKESYAAPRPGEPGAHDGRKKLESITKNLHLVSQTCDTGIANADMSIMLCKEMLDAYAAFSKSDTLQGPPLEPRRQLQDSLGWVLKTWHCQKNWLISYKARKDTAMNFVYNLVTQQDNSVNIDIAHETARHSSSMHAITILTLVFLPGTFLAGAFGSGIFNKQDVHGISNIFWPFIYTLIPLTFVTLGLWFWRGRLERFYKWRQERLLKMKRVKDLEGGIETDTNGAPGRTA
ncbi:hypothetical protein EDD36DRAFT_488149 [Exophiala viscosa]|uniref:Uncharacterized protein n=1 Tax=Exophiala viscosa TaxID=2486360 RepID=A0AAN6IDJ0_9EURO|nr:hypothetical protein EDD36DRAFT_488149 [Exophiala viscosa]